MRNIGIIDIGSNSIRLVLIEVDENNSFEIIDETKETIRLGMDITPDGKLSPVRMERAMRTLSNFKALCEGISTCEVYAVATEAVRKANNSTEFLDSIKAELNINVRLLTGFEEAYYDYFGVINSMEIDNALILDVGGSSTELILVNNKSLVDAVSLSFGALTLTYMFDLIEYMSNYTEQELINYLYSEFKQVPWLASAKNLPIIGVGGTVRTIGKISKKSNNYPTYNLHNYHINAQEVFNINCMVKNRTLAERQNINGLSPERADIFIGASAIVSAIMAHIESHELIVSRTGLREGILYSILANNYPIPVK